MAPKGRKTLQRQCAGNVGVHRLTIWKGGQRCCIFNSCIEKGISAGLIRTYGEPREITTVKAAGALPSFKSGHSSRAPAALTVVMKRGFHQALPI